MKLSVSYHNIVHGIFLALTFAGQDARDPTAGAHNNRQDFLLRALDTRSSTSDVLEHLQSTRQLITKILFAGVGHQLVTHETEVEVR